MFKCSWRALRRICYLTDVEGDMAYFERFVAHSKAVRWERRGGEAAGSAVPLAGDSNSDATTLTVADLRDRYWLGFTDDTTQFVYGGDAFDHGADLSLAQALLDFKRRHPDRVHLILGNRDVNKMVMAPMAALSGASQDPVPSFVNDMSFDARGDFLFPARLHAKRPGGVAFVSYGEFLASPGVAAASPVAMMQWALRFKMGSANAFEHRRRELARLRAGGHHAIVDELVRSPYLKPPAALEPSQTAAPDDARRDPLAVSDGEVAASFFRAAQPGGVYYEYMRHGLLTKRLHGILFVHGGLTEQNLGVIPSTSADVPASAWKRVGPLAEPESVRDATTALASATTSSSSDDDAHDWLRALDQFKDDCWAQWDRFWWAAGQRPGAELTKHALLTETGEPLRTYVYPREVVPYSITVASPVHQDGPSFAALPVVYYLLSSGLHVVCAGHQPSGEMPAVVRQPPADSFFTITGDNSYCGNARAAQFCTAHNQRGKAVAEILFTVDDDGAPDAAMGSVSAIDIRGRDALGKAFAFDAKKDPLVGTGLPDHWWVRNAYEAASTEDDAVAPSDTQYELVRTTDGFRTVECCTLSGAALRARCGQVDRERGQRREHQVGGALKDSYTKAELAEVHVHRLKTKVSPLKP